MSRPHSGVHLSIVLPMVDPTKPWLVWPRLDGRRSRDLKLVMVELWATQGPVVQGLFKPRSVATW
jgi:hypothetical protein